MDEALKMIDEALKILSLKYPSQIMDINFNTFSYFSLVDGRRPTQRRCTLSVYNVFTHHFKSIEAMHQFVLHTFGVKTKEVSGNLTQEQFDRMLLPKKKG